MVGKYQQALNRLYLKIQYSEELSLLLLGQSLREIKPLRVLIIDLDMGHNTHKVRLEDLVQLIGTWNGSETFSTLRLYISQNYPSKFLLEDLSSILMISKDMQTFDLYLKSKNDNFNCTFEKNRSAFKIKLVDSNATDEGIEALAQSLQEINYITNFSFIIQNHKKEVTNKSVTTLFQIFKDRNNLSSLEFHLGVYVYHKCVEEFCALVMEMRKSATFDLDLALEDVRLEWKLDQSRSSLILSLSTNKRMKEVAKALKSVSINELIINSYTISPTHVQSIALLKNIKNLSKLEVNCSRLKITTPGIKALSLALKELESSDFSFHIQGCDFFNETAMKHLSSALNEKKKLTSLTLNFEENKEITNKGMKELSTCLSQMASLQSYSIYLDKCKGLTHEVVDILNSQIKNLKSLKTLGLSLSGFHLNKKSMQAFFKEIRNVKVLKLRFSEITDAGLVIVNSALKELVEVESLELNLHNPFKFPNERIKELSINSLVESIEQLKKLHSVKLDFQQIQAYGDQNTLQSSLEQLGYLKDIEVKAHLTKSLWVLE